MQPSLVGLMADSGRAHAQEYFPELLLPVSLSLGEPQLPPASAGDPPTLAASTTRGQTAEARKTTILQPVEQKPHLQKDRQDEKAEGYVPDEGTRKNPRKTTK